MQSGSLTLGRLIGSGSFGKVYESADEKGNSYAVKVQSPIESSVLREIVNLGNMRGCPNIVTFYEAIRQGKKMYIVMERMDDSLSNHHSTIRDLGQRLDPDEVRSVLRQVLNGLSAMHDKGIVHRDVKPANILVRVKTDGTLQIKIGDLGTARAISTTSSRLTPTVSATTLASGGALPLHPSPLLPPTSPPPCPQVVTIWYRAPEILLAQAYSYPADVWSAAMVLAELVRGTPLIAATHENAQMVGIVRLLGKPPPRNSLSEFFKQPEEVVDLRGELGRGRECELAAELVRDCLQYEPNERPTAQGMLSYSYFQGLSQGGTLSRGADA